MMSRPWSIAVAAAWFLAAQPTRADEYVGLQGFYSSDADRTAIAKTGLDLDYTHTDGEHYQGLSLEHARFRPSGQSWIDNDRIYFRFADGNTAWKWSGRIGSDGHTLLGSAAIHNDAPHRQEYFVEREIVETPLGLQRDIYATYAGAAYDLPINDRNSLATVIGVQDFTGHNVRLQYRGNFAHVLAPDWGLSVQLRMRAFHNSTPNEFDYFSPRWYAEAIPTLQLRRFSNGWRYAVAAGVGEQRSADSAWRSARRFEATVTSPQSGQVWSWQGAFIYSNTPVNSGGGYSYRQVTISLGRRF